tara:strand:- start:215 stop:445 length:231 start_codon:yes stop_codon:yes gene_type:complete
MAQVNKLAKVRGQIPARADLGSPDFGKASPAATTSHDKITIMDAPRSATELNEYLSRESIVCTTSFTITSHIQGES